VPGVLATLGAAVAVAVAPSSALAQGSGYYVTFAARSCPTYQDVFANKARNDIQESLEDLGPDSPYNISESILVGPLVESRPPQTACTPLPGWQFTLGHGYESRAVTGPWGSLSKVTDPFPRLPIVTRSSTPLYNQYHHQVDDLQIPGAVTIELTRAERAQGSNPQSLWAQGGTPDDPVLAQKFPGPEYGFAALRCATDAYNGDNVEYIMFPTGVHHVFCYAFYVKPPPTAGTITIQKHVVGAPVGEGPAFSFNGSISFDPNGFTLANGDSMDFHRAGGQTWEVTEDAVPNYVTSVDCTAHTATGGAGMSTSTIAGSTTSIHLVAAEHVTCVYTNTYQQPSGGLTIDKITRGGVGRFGYTVSPSGVGEKRRAVATTEHPGVPAAAKPSLAALRPGDYTISERSATTDLGRWRTVRVTCDGANQKPGEPVHVTVHSGQTSACVFVNVFIPAGSISLAKVTTGSTGMVKFQIASGSGPAQQFSQHATTTSEGVAADAQPDRPSDATDHVRLGRYSIAEQAPPSEDPDSWALQYVECDGQLVPFDRGAISVTLTPAHPSVHCVFDDHFTPQPSPTPPSPTPPLPPNPPTPPSPPQGNASTYPTSNLSVTKQALDPFAVEGEPVTFRIAVHNGGPDTAANAVLADKPASKATIVYARPSAGQCQTGKIVICRLGNINAGATVVIMVRLTPETTATPFVNRVVVGGATAESSLANNVARSTVRVITPPRHPVACGSRVAPVARVAC
jgi:uncharacterized repeat protein (TIGR01451 family)